MRIPSRSTVILLCALIPSSMAAGQASASAEAPAAEKLAADTALVTARGNPFVAPREWSVTRGGDATILEAPEGDSWIALVDVTAEDAEAALAAAWAAYKPDAAWPLKLATDRPDRDGWSGQRVYEYQVSPNERRDVMAFARHGGDGWTVVIYDVTQPVGEKRGAQVALILDRLLPKGYQRESFAGKAANPLTAERIAELGRFVETGRRQLRVPGVAVGIVEHGKVVFAGGFGVRSLGDPAPVEPETLFMVASNTKALTTLLLAKLVEQGKLTWDTPVTSVLPSFRLGDADTTRQVLVKHLICACTGLPRQDFEWLFEFGDLTPAGALATLATMQPTSSFGELFQYSNPMAGAAGFAAGHLLFPDLELGAAYDRAMQRYVFDPLGMSATTFDYARALAGNHAGAFAPDIDGTPSPAAMEVNFSVAPLRPAGAAWSNIPDMLRYVEMELAEGVLPSGERYIARGPLLARRAAQVAIGNDAVYGMGLLVDTTYDVPVVHHGGDMIGYHSDMMWLPGHDVGAVILTNGDPGWVLRGEFRRKLLEVLFDGEALAEARVAAAAETFYAQLATERKLLTVPADPAAGAALAAHYSNPALGPITVRRSGAAIVFDFGEWSSEVASRRNQDGTLSFLTIVPGLVGFDFVVGTGEKRTLVLRDAQHEYVFTEG